MAKMPLAMAKRGVAKTDARAWVFCCCFVLENNFRLDASFLWRYCDTCVFAFCESKWLEGYWSIAP